MKLLSGRFPHLVEGILGLLDGETLFRCSQVNQIWNKDLENHRLHLVRKSQKHLIIPNIVYENHQKNRYKNHQKNYPKSRQKNRPKNHQKNSQKLVKSVGTNNMNINDNADFDKEEKNSSPEILYKSVTTFTWCPARLCTIEKLPLPILDHFLRYFDNYKLNDCEVNFETMWETKQLVCWNPQGATVQDFVNALSA